MTVMLPRDWLDVERSFLAQRRWKHVVLDDFLKPEAIDDLERSLRNHWGWRTKNWVSDHLHNRQPRIPALLDVAQSLPAALPKLFAGLEVVDYWALMYPKNGQGRLHSDLATLTITIWLTKDECNLSPDTGGLLFTDVLRPARLRPHEYLDASRAEEYVAARTKGGAHRIRYKHNRAVLFDARIFHRTDSLSFELQPRCWRLNASLAFDHPEIYGERLRLYRRQKEA